MKTADRAEPGIAIAPLEGDHPMKDLRTPGEKAFIKDLDAMGEELGEKPRQEYFGSGRPLIIERDGVTMLKHADGRVTPVDGE